MLLVLAGPLSTLGACSHRSPSPSTERLQLEAKTVDSLRRGDFKLVLRVNEVDEHLSAAPQRADWLSLTRMADATESHNPSDHMSPDLPSSRLMAAAVTRDAVVLFVEQGGFVRRTWVILRARANAAICHYGGGSGLRGVLPLDSRPADGQLRRRIALLEHEIRHSTPFIGTPAQDGMPCLDAAGRPW